MNKELQVQLTLTSISYQMKTRTAGAVVASVGVNALMSVTNVNTGSTLVNIWEIINSSDSLENHKQENKQRTILGDFVEGESLHSLWN